MKKNFILSDVNKLKGVGPQLTKYLKKKKIEKMMMWRGKRMLVFG